MRIMGAVAIIVAGMLVACGGAGSDGEGANGAGANGAGAAVEESPSSAGMETVAMTVPSMSCPLCARSIEARLTEAGVRDIRIDLDTKRVTAVFDPSRTTAAEVKALVEGQGFPVTESRRLDTTGVGREP